jgi:hypothetical protein
MSQHALERPSTLMVSQRMSNVAARLLHIQRTAPVAYLVEHDLQQHIEDEPVYSAIRAGKLINNLTWHQLTKEEQQDARNRMFDPNNCGW